MWKLARVLAALLVGCAANVAIAWSCALWSKKASFKSYQTTDVPDDVRIEIPPKRLVPQPWKSNDGTKTVQSKVSVYYGIDRGFGAEFVDCAVNETVEFDPREPWVEGWRACRMRSGWPLPSMEYSIALETPIRRPWIYRGTLHAPKWTQPKMGVGYTYVGSVAGERFLPTRPLALGTIANSIVFAVPVFLLLGVPGGVRRFIRRRAGRCPTCGYDRTGLVAEAPCPECGATTKPAAK